MKLKDNVYETYVNGEPGRLVTGHKTFEKWLERYKERMSKKGYTIIKESHVGYIIFVNYEKQKSLFLSWRNWLGIYDCNGEKIYDGDFLETENGESASFIPKGYSGNDYELHIHHKYEYHPGFDFDSLDICKEYGIHVRFSTFQQFNF